jgi:hypothetical protein
VSRTSAIRTLASTIALAMVALGVLPPEHVHVHRSSTSSSAATVHRHFAPHTHHAPASLRDVDDDDPRVLAQVFASRPIVRLHPAMSETTATIVPAVDIANGRVIYAPALRLVHGPPGSSAAFRAPPFQPAI